MNDISQKLSWLLAAMVAGFAFLGLSYLVPDAYETLFFIIGMVAIVTFAGAIIIRALASLLNR